MPDSSPVAADHNPSADLAPQFDIVAVALELRELHRLAALALSEAKPDPNWPTQIGKLADRLGALYSQAPDALLYLLFFGAARTSDRYSSHHALVCAVAAQACAVQLQSSAADMHSLARAALTMNISITALQDELVHRERTPTLEQRQAIDNHAQASVQMLRERGVDDELWLNVVSQHHEELAAPAEGTSATTEQRLATVLQRIDRCAARMSPRRSRKGMPAMLAIRDAYLGNKGRSDAVGIAVTQALGIYPPGSAVRLSIGETAVVLRRGERASQPLVASLSGADRRPLTPPVLRDMAQGDIRIKQALRVDQLRLTPDHGRLWALLAAGGPAIEATRAEAAVGIAEIAEIADAAEVAAAQGETAQPQQEARAQDAA